MAWFLLATILDSEILMVVDGNQPAFENCFIANIDIEKYAIASKDIEEGEDSQ